ncbi:aspartate dehydrogenase domain-containing protein [Leucobacter denitrificans]|uniref:L-aspartate dehydrogenase n=1 Tax=Leucobacter denitrificans TaxID=683042 RepID=A0A7G9S6T7_9MICO|nr:aspartate dehydrogenase domain-containing protein [Leucobacter denitrificans]QNN63562.1 DUF108 domain-containing protein [Leucobacter denitrificans]
MTSVARGRPQASSCDTLAEAACELFLEQGYDATTVADITRRAGVSRSTFFNYFDGKAATIWFALDAFLAEASTTHRLSPMAAHLAENPPHTLALAIANAEAMGVTLELATGRAQRQAELAALITERIHTTGDPLVAEITGAAYAAAVFAGIWRWAERGAGAHRLDTIITEALSVARRSGLVDRPGRGDLRVSVIGTGAIGARVIRELASGHIAGVTLAGVVTRRPGTTEQFEGLNVTDFGSDIERAIDESDLIVECAGIASVAELGPTIVQAGRDLLIVSIGALADPEMRTSLTAGPGRLRRSSGAIGGLDILRAAARPGGIPGGVTQVTLTSTKRADSLIQQWMTEGEAARLRGLTSQEELFSGTVAEAVTKFPASLNVASALADATGLWEAARVRLIADPHATQTTHEIAASGEAGDYHFSLSNVVNEANVTSSLVVAEAVLSEIATLAN